MTDQPEPTTHSYDRSTWGEQPIVKPKKIRVMNIEMNESTSIFASIASVVAGLSAVIYFMSACDIRNTAIREQEKTKRTEMYPQKFVTNVVITAVEVK